MTEPEGRPSENSSDLELVVPVSSSFALVGVGASAGSAGHVRGAQEMLVHQLELEMQNDELRAAQKALEESRDRYAGLYDFAPVAYYTLDLKGCIQEMNLTGASLIGQDRLPMIGQPFLSLVQVDPPTMFWDHVRRAGKTSGPVTSEWTLRTRGGQMHVQAISSPAFDDHGEVVALRTSLSDITARKRAEVERDMAWKSERALRQQLDRVDQAMRAVTEALAHSSQGSMSHVLQVIADQARVVLSADFAGFGLAGPAGEASSSWIVSGADAAHVLAVGRRSAPDDVERGLWSLGRPGARYDMTVPVTRAGQLLGRMYVANKVGSGAEFSAEDQRSAEMLAARVGTALEIARLYDAATTAIQARDRLLAIVSHDLRNPLSVIALNGEVLLRDPSIRRQADGPAELIKRSTARMATLIQDLLDAATIEAGAFTIAPKLERPELLLQECAAQQSSLIAEKGIRLELDSAAGGSSAFCDAYRVLQVLANLVGNAAKFTPAGGVIRLSVRARAEQLCFSVTDTGSGIATADLPKLFDRYWKGGSQGRPSAGLGLTIAQGIVHAHGGSIWVESELGVGTTVFFLLPAGREPAKTPPLDAPVQRTADRLKGLRVLLVDDEGDAVKALTALLASEGLTCSGTTSAAHALQLLEQEAPDVLVLDMEMPEMNGLELLRRARASCPHLPAIVMSGYGLEHADIETAVTAGSVGYLAKPVELQVLLGLLLEQSNARKVHELYAARG